MVRHGVRRRNVELARGEIARRHVTAEPGPHLGIGAAVERQRMRIHVEEGEREIGDAKA